jgi:hypothetical protein
LPVLPKRPKWAKDVPVEDRPGVITWRQVSPELEGTPQAFGGTAGVLTPLDPIKDLPTPPAGPATEQQVRQAIGDDPETHGLRTTAVLNRNTLFNLSDYERIMLGRQQKHLRDMGNQANSALRSRTEAMRFYNLSIDEIARRTAQVIVAIFADLVEFFSENRRKMRETYTYQETAREFAGIFLSSDRLVYVGVALVVISMIFMIIYLSS